MNFNYVPNLQWGQSVLLRVHQTAGRSINITLIKPELTLDRLQYNYALYRFYPLQHFKTTLVSSDKFYGRFLGHRFVNSQNAKCFEYDVRL